MTYIVMECHLSYAVVLDEEGRFLMVANRQYTVGQTVTDVIEMQTTPAPPPKKTKSKWVYSLMAMAACLVLVVTAVFQMEQSTYASVYMSINPEIRIDVNRNDAVVGLEGMNDDGKELIAGYSFKKKDLDLVCDELTDRAIDMGYLHEGGRIALTLEADDDEWVTRHGDRLATHLNEHLEGKLSVTIEISNTNSANHRVTIPVGSGQSNYGESDYGERSEPDDDADDADPDDSDDDGQTNYGERREEPATTPDDAQSNYGQSADDGGQSPYDASNDSSDDDDNDDDDD